MGSGLGEKDTDDDKGRTGRTEPSAHALCGKLTPLHTVLKKRKKMVKEITLAVYEYLVQEKIQEQLAELEQKFQEDGELALAKEYAQIYRIVLELFDKFVELLGEEEIPLKEYCELLDAGLEEAKVGVIPPSLDQVVIGDMERTRIKNIRALFLSEQMIRFFQEMQKQEVCFPSETENSFRRRK